MSCEPKKSAINVVNKYTHVKVSTVGLPGKDGKLQFSDLNSLNQFTASYYIDSSSILNLIQQATNEQNLSNYAVISGSNYFTGSQYISGSLEVSSITFSDGVESTIENIPIAAEIFYALYRLVNIEGYSTGSTDNLPSSTFNTTSDIPAPWTAFYVESANGTAVSAINPNDILAGAAIIPSQVQTRGGLGFQNVVILNLDLSSYAEIVLPQVGDILTLVRPLEKKALAISTGDATDIFLNPGLSGSVIIDKSLIPVVSNQIDLGLPTRRWRELWIGSGSIYIQDETLAIDHKIGARDGDIVIEGGAGLEVGQFTLHDNYIKIKDSTRDIEFGVEDATGYVNFNRPLAIKSLLTGRTTFNATREGRVQIITPNIPAGDVGALSIIGNASGSYQAVTNTGGMIHVTGNDGQTARITMDAFGTGSFAQFIGRAGRGTAASPLPIKSGDIMARYASVGWISSGSKFLAVGKQTPTSIEMVAAEDFSDGNTGTKINIYNSPIGSDIRTLSATIDTNGLILPNVPSNELADKVLVWDSVTGRVGKQSGISTIDGGAAASIFILSTEVLNGGGA